MSLLYPALAPSYNTPRNYEQIGGKLLGTGGDATQLLSAVCRVSVPSATYDGDLHYPASDPYGIAGYGGWLVDNTWTVIRENFDNTLESEVIETGGDGPHTVVTYASQHSGPGTSDGAGWTLDFTDEYAQVLQTLHTPLTEFIQNDNLGAGPPPYPEYATAGWTGGCRVTLAAQTPGDLPYGEYFVQYTRTYTKPVYSGYVLDQPPRVVFAFSGYLIQRLAGPLSATLAPTYVSGHPSGPVAGITVGGAYPHFTCACPAHGFPFARLDLLLSIADDPDPEIYFGPGFWQAEVHVPGGGYRNGGPYDASYTDVASFFAPPGLTTYEAANGTYVDTYRAAAGFLSPAVYSMFSVLFSAQRQNYPLGQPYVYEVGIPGTPGSYTLYLISVSKYPTRTYTLDNRGYLKDADGPVEYGNTRTVAAADFFTGFVAPRPYGSLPLATEDVFNAADTLSDTYDIGYLPPTVIQIDFTITGTGGGGGGGGTTGDQQDMAQDRATGRVSLVSSDGTVLFAQAWEGWTSLRGDPAKPVASILTTSGAAVSGVHPSLCKVSEEGRASVCYQDAFGRTVRADSRDNLATLEAATMTIFKNADGSAKTGGLPGHIRDNSTGIFYVAASFPHLDGSGHAVAGQEDVLIARLDALDGLLHWQDGTTQKVIASAIAAAGKPSLTQNRYDPQQPLLLLHGDKKYLGTLGGEVWTDIT